MELDSSDLATVALSKDKGEIFLTKDIFSITVDSNTYNSTDLNKQVVSISSDNNLLNRRFVELDARMDIKFAEFDRNFDLLSHQMNLLLQHFDTLSSDETPLLKYSKSSVSTPPPLGFESQFPIKQTYKLSPGRSQYPAAYPQLMSEVVQSELTTRQQQEEIDHTLAVIYSCCPEDEVYESKAATRSHIVTNPSI